MTEDTGTADDAAAGHRPGVPARIWASLKADHGRVLRWVVALLVLTACVVGSLISSFHVCGTETVTNGADVTVTRTCSEPGVGDASVVAVALLIVFLILPDMSEVGVFGLSLKRRIAVAEIKAAESKAVADQLEMKLQFQNSRIENLSQNLASATAQVTSNIFLVGREDAERLDAETRKKADAYVRGEKPPRPSDELNIRQPTTDPVLSSQILNNWEIIAASLNLPPYNRDKFRIDVPRFALTPDQVDEIKSLFNEEIQFVRAARNNVAHAASISDDDLRIAVDVSEQLLRILRSPRREP